VGERKTVSHTHPKPPKKTTNQKKKKQEYEASPLADLERDWKGERGSVHWGRAGYKALKEVSTR